jgi:hypothetical protein
MPDETGQRQSQTSRALVPAGDAALTPATGPRPLAAFLTQLVACHRRVEAYRRHRRGDPRTAAARYAGSPSQTPGAPRFQRVL